MRKYLLLSVALVLMSGGAWAEDNIIGGDCSKTTNDHCSWSYDTTTGALTISGTGKMDDYDSRTSPWYEYREQITNIDIENGITSIGDYAFMETNISTIDFPPSITSLGTYSFLYSKIQSVDIPETITSFSGGAFQGCSELAEVILPENMTTIPLWMFGSATNLADIDIPESVGLIGVGAFINTKIESLVIPTNVQKLEKIFTGSSGKDGIANHLQHLYCTQEQLAQCQEALTAANKDFAPTIYEKHGNDYLVYDGKGNIVGKYASAMNLNKGVATEKYKYDSAGHLVGVFDGNGQRTWGKKIYTIEEAMEATKNGDKFHVYLTYK